MPSLKPNRLRGVAWPVLVDDVRPKPSCDQRTLTTPAPRRTRLRTACTATCGSFAQAWMQRSPPLIAGSSWSPAKAGSSARGAGRRAARPNRSVPSAAVNSVGPKPIVRVSPDAGQPDRLAGVVRRGVLLAVDRADRAGVLPGRHPAGRGGPRLQHLDQLVAVVGGHVEGDEVQPVLRRRDDAGLVPAVERRRRRRDAAARGRRRVERRRAADDAAGGARGQHAGGAGSDPARAAAGGRGRPDCCDSLIGPCSSVRDDRRDLADRLGQGGDAVAQPLQLLPR